MVLIGLLLAVSTAVSAQATLPPLVNDYANYPDTPQAILTAGCDANGDVTGVSFSANGGTAVSGLADLPEMNAGDVLTMTWTGVSADCVGSAISLTVKIAQEPVFKQNVNQLAAPSGYNTTILVDAPGSLSVTLPDLASFGFGCAYQLDAIVGVPLAVVGPSGSDYSASVRGDDRRTTVFSWRNGAYAICVAQATTTSTTAAPPTTTSTTTASTTTTTARTTTTTTAPTTAAPPTSAAAPPSAQGVQAAQATRTLAATGAHPAIAAMGVAVLVLGLTMMAASRRRHSHTYSSS